MAKKKHAKIDYKKAGSILHAKGTKELEDSAKADLKLPDGPMSVNELIERQKALYPDMVVGTHFTDPPVDEAEARKKELQEQDQFDQMLGEDE